MATIEPSNHKSSIEVNIPRIKAHTLLSWKLAHALCVSRISKDAAYRALISDADSIFQIHHRKCDGKHAMQSADCVMNHEAHRTTSSSRRRTPGIPTKKSVRLPTMATHRKTFHPFGHVDVSMKMLLTSSGRQKTFSFEDPMSSHKFTASLTTKQKASINRLHTRVIWAAHTLS